jgi:SPX domain protein involved in polyphosphate accumulation
MAEAPEQSYQPARDAVGTTNRRVEVKYPLAEDRQDAAISAMMDVLPIYRYTGTHDWSHIRTLYLDTPDLQCYDEYLKALPIRRKIRIRQYGVGREFEDKCWVEIKVKNYRLSLKRRFCCLLEDVEDLISGKDILSRARPFNDEDIKPTYDVIRAMIAERGLLPAVRVDYERLSFQQPDDPRIRMTLDRNVRYRSARNDHAGRLPGLIVEVKHNGVRPNWLPGLRMNLGLKRVKRFSKFARSLRALHKYGNFEVNP